MEPRTVVIVGGVAGGASAAARLRRLDEKARIIVFERGEYVSFANCGLPYHLGGEIQDRSRLLVQTPESLKSRFNLDVRIRHEVTAIHRDRKSVTVKDLVSGRSFEQSYDALVLSPGAEPVQPPIPGVNLPGVHFLRTLPDLDVLKARVDARNGGRALVVGGGFIGLEAAEALRHRRWDVTLAEKAPQVMAAADPEMSVYLSRELKSHGVDLRLGSTLKSLSASGDSLRADLDGREETYDLVLMAVGVKPETRLAREAGLELGPRGGIRVDETLRTSDPSIYAVGDAIEVKDAVTGTDSLIPLAGPANRQGRIVADRLAGLPGVYPGTRGTAIVRVFQTALGLTGANERTLRAAGRVFEKIYLHPSNHATYYPGASPLHLKILYEPATGLLLGAQAAGVAGVDKFIDVMAVALQAKWTVRDLQDLELAYAPPFGSAKSPANFAGFIAGNAIDRLTELFHAPEAAAPLSNQFLLDVRTPREFREGTIPGAVNIPVDDLRSRLSEIPKDRELLVFCRVGLRGHVATRLLAQEGFRARNLSGGWLTWVDWKESQAIS